MSSCTTPRRYTDISNVLSHEGEDVEGVDMVLFSRLLEENE
jgi:hypothetical protein